MRTPIEYIIMSIIASFIVLFVALANAMAEVPLNQSEVVSEGIINIDTNRTSYVCDKDPQSLTGELKEAYEQLAEIFKNDITVKVEVRCFGKTHY